MEYLADLLYLCPLLLIAGILDGIAGGGGIIALPAYLLTGMPVHCAYACNKLQSGLGTACSAGKYIKEGLADIKTALISLPFTILGSMAATRLILSLDAQVVKLIIAVCIPLAAVLMFAKRKLSQKTVTRVGISTKTVALCIFSGLILGAYDGLFGPGGGTVAMIVFSLLMNYDLRVGCGNGKIIIVVSNITAVIHYITGGYMIWHVALPCAAANMLGSYLGAALAVKKGEKLVTAAMVTVIVVLVVQTVLQFFLPA